MCSVALAASALSCGPPKVPGAAPRARGDEDREPTGEQRCTAEKTQSEPLIIEWPSTSRAKLESLARHGLVAVRYRGCDLQVLAQCKVPGSYVYTPITRKHDLVKMRDVDELYATVPLGAASLEGRLKERGELDVAMTIVGRFEATRASVHRDELQGDECAQATHVVTAMIAGSFDFSAGAGIEGSAGASAFGASAGGSTASSNEHIDSDGDEKSCEKAALTDVAPPDGCGALLRIELAAVGAARAVAAIEPCPEATQWDGTSCARVEVVAKIECPSAARLEGDVCVPIAPSPAASTASSATTSAPIAAAKGCRYGDATDCTMQCNVAGDAGSCNDLALMYLKGEGVSADPKKAASFYFHACELGSALGCNQAGMRAEDGLGCPKDDVRAVALYQKACDGGKAEGCTNLGRMIANGWGAPQDEPRAIDLLAKGCNLGDPAACSNLGWFYVKGRGAAADRPRGVALLRKGCLGGNLWGCSVLDQLGEPR